MFLFFLVLIKTFDSPHLFRMENLDWTVVDTSPEKEVVESVANSPPTPHYNPTPERDRRSSKRSCSDSYSSDSADDSSSSDSSDSSESDSSSDSSSDSDSSDSDSCWELPDSSQESRIFRRARQVAERINQEISQSKSKGKKRGWCAAASHFGDQFCQYPRGCKYQHPSTRRDRLQALSVLSRVEAQHPFCFQKMCLNLVSHTPSLYCRTCKGQHRDPMRELDSLCKRVGYHGGTRQRRVLR